MLVKLAKQNTNKAKDSLRKVRTNAMNKLKKSKDKASEDTIRLIEKQVLLPTDVVLMYLTQKIDHFNLFFVQPLKYSCFLEVVISCDNRTPS